MFEVHSLEDFYSFHCPNCYDEIIVHKSELNCKIFRHAIYKETYIQVNPHLSKQECDKLINDKLVYGCCKPFEIIEKEDKLYVIICDYK